MGTFEVVTMVVTLVVMFAAIGAKILTSQFLNRMQNSIAVVTQARQKTMGELKLAESQKKVAQQNKTMLTKKKAKLGKKINRLKKELGGMKNELESRQKMRDAMRGKLVRPTLVAPQEGAPEVEE